MDVQPDAVVWAGTSVGVGDAGPPRAAHAARARSCRAGPLVQLRRSPRADLGEAVAGPLLPGSVNLAPAELGRFAGSKLPFSHLELTFDHAVAGPVVVGRGRHFGLGLCAPVGGVLK
jgi:CRISPR-associated protein Csb2